MTQSLSSWIPSIYLSGPRTRPHPRGRLFRDVVGASRDLLANAEGQMRPTRARGEFSPVQSVTPPLEIGRSGRVSARWKGQGGRRGPRPDRGTMRIGRPPIRLGKKGWR